LDLPRGVIFTAVRQQPLTATLSPTYTPRPQMWARTVISMDLFVGVIFSMTPASSTMPVNIGKI